MPIQDYGVWKGKPVSYKVDKPRDPTPHISLIFKDDHDNHLRAAINVKSSGSPSELVYWVDRNFSHPITRALKNIPRSFQPIDPDSGPTRSLSLDYFRGNLLQIRDGRVLPFMEGGPDNDILDQLKPILDDAIDQKADIYLFGSRFKNARRGDGIHNVHMNQGSPQEQFKGDNGVGRDGGFLLYFPEDDHWEAVFLGFASQCNPTNDITGQPAPRSKPLGDIISGRRHRRHGPRL
jgi:uncharacterized protein YukJ